MTHSDATLTQALGIAKRIASMATLRRDLKRHGIQQKAIAARAVVGPSLVAHVLAGRALSANVVRSAREMVGEAEARLRLARTRRRNGQ